MIDYGALSDGELMNLYKGGEQTAFEELYRRHSARVYGYLSRRLSDPERLRDIFQDVFLRLHKGRLSYDSHFRFKPWFFTLVRSAFVDYDRKWHRVREEPYASNNLVFEESVSSDTAADFLSDGVEVEFESLSPRERTVLELHYQKDLSFEQIAARLEISTSAGRQIASRAIRKLRRIISARPS